MNSNSHPALSAFVEGIQPDESLPWSLDRPPVVLTIASSDPSGGAGIQADLKTFAALGAYGASVITTVTVQNTLGVTHVHHLPVKIVRDQLRAVIHDFDIRAIKIGAIGDFEVVKVLEEELKHFIFPIVLDPIHRSTNGASLANGREFRTFFSGLLYIADLITPNIPEAEEWTGIEIDSIGAMEYAAERLIEFGASNVLLKGGHLEGPEIVDILVTREETYHFRTPRIESKNLHGTGCTLSSAIVAALGYDFPLLHAVQIAKEYVTGAIEFAKEREIGAGIGPLDHEWIARRGLMSLAKKTNVIQKQKVIHE